MDEKGRIIMRSTKTWLAALSLVLFVLSVCCIGPAIAQDTTTTAPTMTTAPATEPPSDLQTAAPTQPTDQPEQTKQSKRRLVLVPAFNMYYPTDAKTKARFGDSWPSIGLSVAWRDKKTDPRKIELRLDGMGRSSDSVKALVFPLGIGISQRLSSSKNLTTYAGVSGNLYFGKVVSDPDSINTGWRMVAGPGAYVGANIGDRFNVQASYYGVPSLGGFGLSGFNISAHIQLF